MQGYNVGVQSIVSRLLVKVREDGSIELSGLGYPPGTLLEVQLEPLSDPAQSRTESLGTGVALTAQPVLAAFWDSPEEDAAWRDL